MTIWNRRQWLTALGTMALGGTAQRNAYSQEANNPAQAPKEARRTGELLLSEFQPRSTLRVPESKVPRARFPVIDFHTHLGFNDRFEKGVGIGEGIAFLAAASELLPVMDARNVHTMVNLTGGTGAGLDKTLATYDRAHPGRFLSFTEPTWKRINEPGYAKWQADDVVRAHRAGARGLKCLKTLGLYLRSGITTGELLKVDDARFDLMWEVCAAEQIPVAMHVSDPEAFFLPIDRYNERYEELHLHPDWSFYGRDFPPTREILEARNRVLARHPKTQFVTLHFGNLAEDLGYVSECMERFPNMYVDTAARLAELGRQPRMARKFIDRWQDRVVFATDAVPHGEDVPAHKFTPELYEIFYRFLETEDEYFDYSPAPTPPQGRWRISGIGLPEPILKKVYHDNAARLLGLTS